MGQINSITVRASDGIKTADYAPPKLYDITAIIIPTDDNNVDALLSDVLSRISRAGQAYLTGRVPAKSVGEVAAETPVEDPKPATRKRRTAAEIAADAALAKAGHPKGEVDPSAVVDDEPNAPEDDPSSAIDDEPGDGSPDPADLLPSEDDFNIEPEGEEPAEEITDAALNAAVQRKNQELGDPEAIRGVIKFYNPDPTKTFQLREIPQNKRAEFITKLGGLVKSA